LKAARTDNCATSLIDLSKGVGSAVQLADTTAVPLKPRSRKNRYLLAAFEMPLEATGDADDRGAGRDNFRDNPL
jgi:hypothetical protein